MILTKLIEGSYRRLARPLLFRLDPERVHERAVALGERLGRYDSARAVVAKLLRYDHPALEQNLLGLRFRNPVGLPAGFDKNARLWRILPAVGFGFSELGSITAGESGGNPRRPRLWRRPAARSLIVGYGLPSEGAARVARRLPKPAARRGEWSAPLGLNIAFTNTHTIVRAEQAIDDYLASLEILAPFADYLTLNLSCPNRLSDRLFAERDNLNALLDAVDRLQLKPPLLLKLSPDLNQTELDAVLTAAERHRVAGFVASNLHKDAASEPRGGVSGPAYAPLADRQIAWLRRYGGPRFLIIGVGGVFTAADAYRKIRLGASLVQILTGLIYEGPQRVGQINRGLVELLRRDGFATVGEAVGVDIDGLA